MKSEWSWGFGIGKLEVFVLSVAAEVKKGGVNDDTGCGEEVAGLDSPGGGTPTVAHCITDPDWLLPFTAGVAD